MRRWIVPVLILAVGFIVGAVGYVLVNRAAAFPGPVTTVDATVLDSRASSCDREVDRVRVRFELDDGEHVADLRENDCDMVRTKGEVVKVYVLNDWPQYAGSCSNCLPVDADDAPEIYDHMLGGFGLIAIGVLATVTGLVLSVIAAVRSRRVRQ